MTLERVLGAHRIESVLEPAVIEDAFRGESIVILDRSCNNFWKGERLDFLDYTYHIKTFRELDRDLLLEETESLEGFQDLLRRPESWISHPTADEFSNYVNIVGDKYRFLKKHSGEESSQEALFRNMHEISFELFQLAKSKDLRKTKLLDPHKQKLFAEILIDIDKTMHLQHNSSYAHHTSNDPNKRADADDYIVSSAVNLASTRFSPRILSGDMDLFRILRKGVGVLCADYFSPLNNRFAGNLASNPVSFYFSAPGEVKCYSTAKFDGTLPAVFERLGHMDKQHLAGRIRQFWRQYNSLP